MPNFSSLEVPQVVFMTTCGAGSEDKAVIIKTLSSQINNISVGKYVGIDDMSMYCLIRENYACHLCSDYFDYHIYNELHLDFAFFFIKIKITCFEKLHLLKNYIFWCLMSGRCMYDEPYQWTNISLTWELAILKCVDLWQISLYATAIITLSKCYL